MTVRPVTPPDAPIWLEMRAELWPGSRDDHAREISQFFAGQSREPLAVLLAIDDEGRAAGFVELSIHPYAEGCSTHEVAFVEGWYVRPSARRRGIGRALIDASEAWARSRGCSEIASDAEADNVESAAAHRAAGFQEAGLIRCFCKALTNAAPPSPTRVAPNAPKLYGELASWWPAMSPPAEYVEESAFYRNVLHSAARQPIRSLLELGSGGGHNASHLKQHFDEVVLVDRSVGMLAASRRLNPELQHHEGDMRTVRLGRQFDAVFIHDAICYMTTEEDLRRALETAFVHCKPGAVALFAPDYVRENFKPGADHGGTEEGDRAMRWLEWTWDPNPTDTTYLVDYAYLMRNADGSTVAEHDRHVEGIFPRATWLRLLSDVGFGQVAVVPLDIADVDPGGHEVFVAIKPASAG